MTDPIDTTPEAIAAIIARYTQAFGLASEAYDKGYHNAVKEMAAEIARLNRALNEALTRAERSERCEVAAHDAANTAIKQRDEARALLALISTKQGIGHATPADATAALARRDAAMRNEGRRQAAEIARDDAKSETGPILRRRLAGNGTPVAASARRTQAIRTAHRILAALEPEGGE